MLEYRAPKMRFPRHFARGPIEAFGLGWDVGVLVAFPRHFARGPIEACLLMLLSPPLRHQFPRHFARGPIEAMGEDGKPALAKHFHVILHVAPLKPTVVIKLSNRLFNFHVILHVAPLKRTLPWRTPGQSSAISTSFCTWPH